MNNGNLSPELAEKIYSLLSVIDSGNETIMTDSFTKFTQAFPETKDIANKIYQREVGRPFRTYVERASKRGY